MSALDWLSLLRDPTLLGTLYAENPPAPEKCSLYYVHLDERGESVTLGFETRTLPSLPSPEWSEGTYNTLEFYLTFLKVTGLRANGWGATEASGFDIEISPERSVLVTLGSTDAGISFRSPTVRLASVRTYLAAE